MLTIRCRFFMTGIILVSLIGTASAQPVTNTVERLQDHKQIADGRADIANSRRDVDRLSDLIMAWDDHRKAENKAAEKEDERLIAIELRRDLSKTVAKDNQSSREIAQSSREVRSSRRELFRDPSHPLDNRHDLRDDRRDRRDDIRDKAKMDELLKEKTSLATELRALRHDIDTKAIDEMHGEGKMSALFSQYLTLSREEVAMGIRELREDKRELREDRRETHEDIHRH